LRWRASVPCFEPQAGYFSWCPFFRIARANISDHFFPCCGGTFWCAVAINRNQPIESLSIAGWYLASFHYFFLLFARCRLTAGCCNISNFLIFAIHDFVITFFGILHSQALPSVQVHCRLCRKWPVLLGNNNADPQCEEQGPQSFWIHGMWNLRCRIGQLRASK
jgi:hypothetical protein